MRARRCSRPQAASGSFGARGSVDGVPLAGRGAADLLLLLTVSALAVLLAAWPKLGGRTVGRLPARPVVLVLAGALVVATAAVEVGAGDRSVRQATDPTTAGAGGVVNWRMDPAPSTASSPAVPATARRRPLPRTDFGPDGVGTFRVTGRASGITGNVVVQVPPGYFDQTRGSTRYPVLEAFSGYPENVYQWTGSMDLGGVMAGQVATGHLRPALIVTPQTSVPPGVDTECVNGMPGNPQVETWLTKDVPAWVAHTFRVQTARSSWATIGLSYGGWCAAMAAMLHPAQYSAAIVLGGYFRPDFGPFYQAYPPSSPLAAHYDLGDRAQGSPPPVSVWLQTSPADHLSYASSAAFIAAARPPLAVHAVVLPHAGHHLSVWRTVLPEALRWLGSTVPSFR